MTYGKIGQRRFSRPRPKTKTEAVKRASQTRWEGGATSFTDTTGGNTHTVNFYKQFETTQYKKGMYRVWVVHHGDHVHRVVAWNPDEAVKEAKTDAKRYDRYHDNRGSWRAGASVPTRFSTSRGLHHMTRDEIAILKKDGF